MSYPLSLSNFVLFSSEFSTVLLMCTRRKKHGKQHNYSWTRVITLAGTVLCSNFTTGCIKYPSLTCSGLGLNFLVLCCIILCKESLPILKESKHQKLTVAWKSLKKWFQNIMMFFSICVFSSHLSFFFSQLTSWFCWEGWLTCDVWRSWS